MENHTRISGDGVGLWQRVIELQGQLTPSAARALLTLDFSERDHDLMCGLSAKPRAGSLTSHEQIELDTFERLGCLLDIVHSKARQALKKSSPRPAHRLVAKKPRQRP